MTAPSPVIRLADLRCDCGSDDLAAVAPGTEPDAIGGANVDQGQPVRAWCWNCWMPAMRAA